MQAAQARRYVVGTVGSAKSPEVSQDLMAMAGKQGIVFVTGSAVSGAALELFLKASGLPLASVRFGCLLESSPGSEGHRYDVALLLSEQAPSLATLAAVAKALAPGAALYLAVQTVGWAASACISVSKTIFQRSRRASNFAKTSC